MFKNSLSLVASVGRGSSDDIPALNRNTCVEVSVAWRAYLARAGKQEIPSGLPCASWACGSACAWQMKLGQSHPHLLPWDQPPGLAQSSVQMRAPHTCPPLEYMHCAQLWC